MSVDILSGIVLPYPPDFANNAPTYESSLVIDASAEKAAFIFQVPKTGTLDKVEFRTGTVSFLATSDLRVSFQDVSATTGDPDETQDQFRSITSLSSNTWTVPGLMTSDGTDGGVKRSVTQGDILAVVFEYQNFVATDSVVISAIGVGGSFANFPYPDLKTGGTWAKTAQMPVMALKYSDSSYAYVPGTWPAASLTTTGYGSGSTPDERGVRIRLAAPVRVAGYWWRGSLTAGASYDVILYNSSGTALATHTVDTDKQESNTSNFSRFGLFPSSVSLSANTDYRLVIKPDANNVTLSEFTTNVATILEAAQGGSEWQLTSRTDGGAWTETSTQRPWMGLILDGLQEVASVGGQPTMRRWGGVPGLALGRPLFGRHW